LSNSDAEKLLESLNSANKGSDFNFGLAVLQSANKRTLIKDLDNPVPVTISIVDRPCVPNAIWTSIKNDPANKAGRTLSNSNFTKLQSVIDLFQKASDGLKDIFTTGANERTDPLNKDGAVIDANKSNLEVDDMDEKQLREVISEEVGKSNKSLETKIEDIEKRLPEAEKADTTCSNCGATLGANDKFCPLCGTKVGGSAGKSAIKCTKCDHEITGSTKFCPKCGDKIEAEKSEVEKRFEAIESENTSLKSIIKDKLGIEVESHKINSPETPDPTPAKKTDVDFYKEAGLKSTGRPLE
jgi:uncharacterized OB-fold protein